ncbi:MAG: glycerol-3-phosphate 1-O-acyltransferase PlsY [Eubacteriales bacterium]|nr:glycerol-3-phosphate 1-O-acyltransferase PlsY [Eubacteriales bacterium]
MVVKIICCLILGYICGLFPTAWLIGRRKKTDLRQRGSGNLGTTNVMRTLGPKAGVLTYIGDALKGVLPILAVWLWLANEPAHLLMYQLYTGMGAMLGHCFPFFLKFKGGKGIATMTGVMLAIHFPIGLIGVSIFFFSLIVIRYVSVSSLLMSFSYALMFIMGAATDHLAADPVSMVHIIILCTLMYVLTLYSHRANILRLINGTEDRKNIFKKRVRKR